jgi:hypothetical protein
MSDIVEALLGPIFQARQQASPDFMARDNVLACGVGYKISGQTPTQTPCVVVSVTRKLPPSQLAPGELIPPSIQGVLTDVVETGEIIAFGVDRTIVMRPARPGVSVSNINGPTGTIGCIVRRGSQLLLLSNNHVLGLLNDAHLGDAIVQPGTADGGTMVDQIGTLVQFAPIAFLDEAEAAAASSASAQSTQPQGCAVIVGQLLGSLLNSLSNIRTPTTALPPPPVAAPGNLVDAAIAAPLSSGLLDPNIIDIGAPPQGIAETKLGMQVFKSGRTSGVSEGTITQVDVDVNVRYDNRVARFSNQIMITPCSQPGDSGSLLLDFQRNAVGLVFSGSNLITVANPIRSVLAALNVELVTTATAASPAPETG